MSVKSARAYFVVRANIKWMNIIKLANVESSQTYPKKPRAKKSSGLRKVKVVLSVTNVAS